MADGRLTTPPFGYGGQHPLCTGKCRGSERDRLSTPAKFGRSPDGRKLMWCPCCNTELREARPGETGLQNGSHLSLIEGVQSEGRVMVDDICRYDVVWLTELKPT